MDLTEFFAELTVNKSQFLYFLQEEMEELLT